jgi:poly-gamma-glutamate synthesis protein (capsule biosynthesis protein)
VGAIARNCIDAGAAMFVSHGAPVLQPLEIYKGRPIFYSLGNFIFHVRSEKSPWRAREVWESVVGLCSFGDDGALQSLSVHPVVIGGVEALEQDALDRRVVPEVVTGADAARILQRFKAQCADVGTEVEIDGDVGYVRSLE